IDAVTEIASVVDQMGRFQLRRLSVRLPRAADGNAPERWQVAAAGLYRALVPGNTGAGGTELAPGGEAVPEAQEAINARGGGAGGAIAPGAAGGPAAGADAAAGFDDAAGDLLCLTARSIRRTHRTCRRT